MPGRVICQYPGPFQELVHGEGLGHELAGAGYLAKLLVNLLWFGQAIATAEALLAPRAGLDLNVRARH